MNANNLHLIHRIKQSPQDIAGIIDHTLLKPQATISDIKNLCAEAKKYRFASVCIHPYYVSYAVRELQHTDIKVGTVVGFPLGANLSTIKAAETQYAIQDGAREIDMVMNIGALKSSNYNIVSDDLSVVIEICEKNQVISKVIIETALLTDEEKVAACELVLRAKSNFVKTSTGFAPGGAKVNDVKLLYRVVSAAGVGVKAAGGIRSFVDALQMIGAGASRIGTSSGVKIMQEALNSNSDKLEIIIQPAKHSKYTKTSNE